jgi:hypothetical protein
MTPTTDETLIREAIDYLHNYAMIPTDSPPMEGDGQFDDALAALDRLVAERDYFRSRLTDFSRVAQEDFGRAVAAEARVVRLEAALQEIAACADKPYCGDCYQIARAALGET